MINYHNFFNDQLNHIRDQGRYRVFIDIERCAGRFPLALCRYKGKTEDVVVWCGNDYLGMGQHPDVMAAVIQTVQRFGAGSGGTRNISGNTHAHVVLEDALCDWHHKEAALVFTSGYVANETTLMTLGKYLPDCVFLSDEKNHASIIHGMRNSRAARKIFRHNDVAHLEELLMSIDSDCPKVIVFESIYSMDGDVGSIAEICALAKRYNALTYLDEVHAVGLYGTRGGGMAQHHNVEHHVDIIQGTLGKAIGLIGGYIASDRTIIDFIRSFSPGFIFTTSLPPAIVAGATASINHLKTSNDERQRQQFNVQYLKQSLDKAQIPYLAGSSHIVPVVVGNALRCKQVADHLLEHYKIYVQPINYPTVPVGTERLRLTPSAMHTSAMIDDLTTALYEIWHDLHLMKAA